MWTEARDAGRVVRRQFQVNKVLMRDLGARGRNPDAPPWLNKITETL